MRGSGGSRRWDWTSGRPAPPRPGGRSGRCCGCTGGSGRGAGSTPSTCGRASRRCSGTLRPRFAAMLGDAAAAMIASGQAALTEYRWDGRLVASDLAVIGPDWVGAYLYGAEPDLRTGMDVALMLLGNDLRLACRGGLPFLSLLRGQEDYKLKWRPDLIRNERIVLCRSARSAGYLGFVAGRTGLTRLSRIARTRGRHAGGLS
ncbi:GNAT family N-acetyltransferase [Spirillospora sp. NPDC052269]